MKMCGAQGKTLAICALVLAGLQLGGCASTKPQATSPSSIAGAESARTLGVNILGVRRSAAGYMLDLRYTVVDPEKAQPLVDRKVRPYLIDQATGAKLFVPASAKLGPLRQTGAKAVPGQIYFALFANPGRYVEPGRKVTLVVGDQQVPDLIVN
jgi:hypothetical protein